MKTEPRYILQHSLLTRKVFIIYKYKEDLNYVKYEDFLGTSMPWTRFLIRTIYPLVSQQFRHRNSMDYIPDQGNLFKWD